MPNVLNTSYSFSLGGAVYSFWTETDFDCLDLNEATMSGFFSLPGLSISRGTPWIQVSGHDLIISSSDDTPTIVSIPLNIGQQFTLETTFKPKHLPVNLDDLAKSRFFIGAFDAQDNAGGVLVSKGGLAIVSSFGNTVMPIAGSQNILEEGDEYYTVRMVVDGKNNVMDLYITRTIDVNLSGHVLRYTTAAPITPAGTVDQVRVEVIGNATTRVQIEVDTLRCNCNELLIPNLRPIADTGRDQTAVVGSVLQLDGTGSYDPEGEELTYKWSLYAAPLGSIYRLSGTGAFTTDDADADTLTPFLEATGDPWSAGNAPGLQPGDILIIGDDQYKLAYEDWLWNAATKKYDRGPGFDNNKLRIDLDALPINTTGIGWDIYYAATFFDDVTSPTPTFAPDIAGLYGVQLVVNDGYLWSLPDQGLINISQSNVLFGYVPDVNFIWDYLSDAWSLYDDRDPVTTIWSGFAQVASNILLTAWQLDYAKSLVDIQRQFQRRWLGYHTLLEEPELQRDDVVVRVVRGKISGVGVSPSYDFGPGETLLLAKDGGAQVEVSLVGTKTPQEVADLVNDALGERSAAVKTASIGDPGDGSSALVLSHPGLLVVFKEGSANGTLGLRTEEDTQNALVGVDGDVSTVAGEETGFFIDDAANPFVDFSGSVAKGDLLVFGGVGYEIVRFSDAVKLVTKQPMVLPDVKDWEVSSTITADLTNFSDELVAPGDICILEIRQTGGFEMERVLCAVTGARDRVLGFDPRPLLERTGGDLDSYDVALFGVQRCSSIPVNELVNKIPRLQEILLDPPNFLSENQDYIISTNSDEIRGIHFRAGLYSFDNPPPDTLWAESTWLDNKQMIEDNFGKPAGFLVEQMEEQSGDLDYLSSVRGLWYAFYNGPSLWNVRIGIQILLGMPFAEVDGEITDVNETYSATQIRVLIQDSADRSVTRSYLIPRNRNFEEDGVSMIADNPLTATTYQVGDTIDQFSPLSKGLELLDWVSDPEWWTGYVSQGARLEVDKFFQFLCRADIDVFNIANLVFAIDFVKKIKPHYTNPMWVVFKRLPRDTISVTDPEDLEKIGTLYLYDHPACAKQIADQGTGGSYRFDDTDESGNYNWAFDGPEVGGPIPGGDKPKFLYDRKKLCPSMRVVGVCSADLSGGIFPFDWLWAFDDGGGVDDVPLSGPIPSAPPSGGPYGPLVGVIEFDKTDYPPGWYTRSKVL